MAKKSALSQRLQAETKINVQTPDLYVRQRQLPEIGTVGQSKIERSPLFLPPSCSNEEQAIAELYGCSAGLCLTEEIEFSPDFLEPLRLVFQNSKCRDVGVGAALALSSILLAVQQPHD